MYRTESLVQYFPRLAFLNFIFNFILSCFFPYLEVYANEAECKHDVTKDWPIEIQIFQTLISRKPFNTARSYTVLNDISICRFFLFGIFDILWDITKSVNSSILLNSY